MIRGSFNLYEVAAEAYNVSTDVVAQAVRMQLHQGLLPGTPNLKEVIEAYQGKQS